MPLPRFLVTAGNTRERVDRVRAITNIFTGQTGLNIARALAGLGRVDLLTSNAAHLAGLADATPRGRLTGHAFDTHADLVRLLGQLMTRHTYAGVFMTAAVADYAPTGVYAIEKRQPARGGGERWLVREVSAGKVKSTHKLIAIAAKPTRKVVDLFRTRWNHRGLLVKFKLEVGIAAGELLRIAEASRVHSGADYIVANTLAMVSGRNAGAYLLGHGVQRWVPRADLPGVLAELAGGRP